MEEKKHLAYEIVKLVWGDNDAKEAQEKFEKTFQEKTPIFNQKVDIGNFTNTIAPFTALGSISDAKRYISQGSIDVNGETITDPTYKLKSGDKIKVGEKTFIEVI